MTLKTQNDKELPTLRSEVLCAIKKLKVNKTPGDDNINGELIQHGGDSMVDVLLILCNKILETGNWPTQWTESTLIPTPKKSNSKKMQRLSHYKPDKLRKQSSPSNPSKQNRTQSGASVERNAMSNQYSDWFQAPVGVRQGCILSPTLFNLLLERIMNDALEEYRGGISYAAAKAYGMEISVEKNMVTGKDQHRTETSELQVQINQNNLEQVNSFKYLGVKITANCTSDDEIN
ncbi:uncharacterized protein LOC134767142 [Penaeus indicus]|uniref:uncharacterized protein LOC134767142 n=1 Tax=Penaeus indicus TaxID=29960 RepID=UPI00300DBCA1